MLSEEEWELLDKLIDLLMPFENTTRNFSGGTYVTLSTIISTIKKLIFDLACESPLDNINYLDENTIFETEPFTDELLIEIEDEEIISNISKRRVSIKNPLDTTGILEKVKNNIYFALIYYWNFSNDIELMASLLDPRFKTLDFVESEDEKMRIIQKLRNELDPNNSSPVESSSSTIPLTNDTEFSLRSHKEYRQYRLMKNKNLNQSNININIDEVDSYLAKPAVLENVNPLEWWQVNMQLFPKLSKIARKYLGIPATSVSCERLFSHANNIITTKRIRLDTDLAGKMLFLKRNLNSMEVFAKEWDEIEEMQKDN